jgi:hypothetical protein
VSAAPIGKKEHIVLYTIIVIVIVVAVVLFLVNRTRGGRGI